MSWLQISLAVLSLVNLVFVLAAAYLLNEILRTTEVSKNELIKAARQSSEGAHSLLVAARRSVAEMERVHQAHLAHENSSARAIHELSAQIRLLSQTVNVGLKKEVEGNPSPTAGSSQAEDARSRLRADLNAALATNHRLQDELEQTQQRLHHFAQRHGEIRQELQDTKEVRQEQAHSLLQRLAELETELRQAQERARAAERHAEDNARLLDDIREQAHAKWFDVPDPAVQSLAPDQSGLIADQQEQIDALAAREKKLLDQIEQLQGSLQRNLTEKEFIEERFLQMVPNPDGAGA